MVFVYLLDDVPCAILKKKKNEENGNQARRVIGVLSIKSNESIREPLHYFIHILLLVHFVLSFCIIIVALLMYYFLYACQRQQDIPPLTKLTTYTYYNTAHPKNTV